MIRDVHNVPDEALLIPCVVLFTFHFHLEERVIQCILPQQ